MWFNSIVSRGVTPVLEQIMVFTEERQNVLADNISNIDTVNYKMKDLDVDAFSASLSEAIEKRSRKGGAASLEMKSSRNLSWDSRGRMQASTIVAEPGNILFYDKNNRSVEKQMSEMAKNGMTHNLAVELLRGKYSGLEKAIRGTL